MPILERDQPDRDRYDGDCGHSAGGMNWRGGCRRGRAALAPIRARSAAGASTSAAALRASSDRALLLCEQRGELRRARDPCLERRPALRRERAVGERCQLDDLPIGVLSLCDDVSATWLHER